MKLTNEELDCIRFYMGDPEIVERGDFLGGPKAYNTINALLHEGIGNELDKIRDGKPVEILNSYHLRQMLSTIQTIDCAMKKCTFEKSPLVTYRVDRISEVEAIRRKKCVEGFYSTCKNGYLEEYARTKQNLVLMEIHRDRDVGCLDFEELFQDSYAKQEEAEILLAYDSVVQSIELYSCTEEEKKKYRDLNNQEPVAKAVIVLEKRKEEKIESMDLYALTCDDCVQRLSWILKQLTKTQSLSSEDEQFYVHWKHELKKALKSAA